jgi:regulator of cell morphogenesis and NO signaling
MEINSNSMIGQIVASDYRAAEVFKSFGIDFCCRGNRTIKEVCENGEPDMDVLVHALSGLKVQSAKGENWDTWPLDLLADYIETKHHRYVEEKTPVIKEYLAKICSVHGGQHTELFEIKNLFFESAGELAAHMKKEELVLFPFVRKEAVSEKEHSPLSRPFFGTVQNPVYMMEQDHDAEGERFRKIAKLSNNYTPPPGACNTYKVAFALLQEFEEDLHQHIHLENNILFPKAIAAEKSLRAL